MFNFTKRGILRIVSKHFLAALLASLVLLVPARAQLIVGNQLALESNGGAAIQTNDFATGALVASFVPTGAGTPGSGINSFGVETVGNIVYYTVASNAGVTDVIHVAPFNGGVGGADLRTFPNPVAGSAVTALSYAAGVLYLLEFSPTAPVRVCGIDAGTGAVVRACVPIGGGAGAGGLAVLPNGNFLIGSAAGVYDQYNPSTGAVIAGTTITLSSLSLAVDTDGTSLFFSTRQCLDFLCQSFADSYTKTDMLGNVVATRPITPVSDSGGNHTLLVDISLLKLPGGTPGSANCNGKTTSSLAKLYGGMPSAAAALGYPNVGALQAAINTFCGN